MISTRSFIWGLVLTSALTTQVHATYWIFLNSGTERAKTKDMPKEEVAKMQATHVGNFSTQFNKGTLMAAGPLGDNGFIRGTVILSVQTPGELAECFKTDPFVQNHILDVEAYPWMVDVMRFGTPNVPFQMARHTLCVVKKGTKWAPMQWKLTDGVMLNLFPELEPKWRSGELALAGPFPESFQGSNDKLGILMFYSSNEAQIKMEMEKQPVVTRGEVEFELHPQFLGKGTLKDPTENLSPPKREHSAKLFDGKTFTGWDGDTNHTWRIEKGALVGGSLNETVQHNDFLCTIKEYANFDLRLKVKLSGTGFVNGGIQLRSQRLKNPAFEMTGYQADMGEGYWASLYDESRRNKTLAHTHAPITQRIVKTNDWNDYIIRCEGPHIRLWLNGVLTVDYTEDEKEIPTKGLIGVQIHGGGKAEASYKDIAIEELP